MDYEKHLNRYNVVCLDIAGLISELKKDHRPIRDITTYIQEVLRADLIDSVPDLADTPDVSNCLIQLVEATGRKIVFVIDEWDAVIREATKDEQALRYVVKFAYIAAVNQYIKVEELPSGHGIADVAYLPKRRSRFPAMVIELKWNKTAEGAIGQIK